MTYNINNTIGTQLFQVADGTINSDLSLTLVGRNYSGWGETVNENFVKLLENSAGSNEPAPAKLLTGQLWYDTGDSVAGRLPQLKIYNGTRFKP
jgi:glycosylphosphatidylinositol transamidase (GPIT) subunit GPI8